MQLFLPPLRLLINGTDKFVVGRIEDHISNWRYTMNKIVLSLIALAAVSSAALAERNYDLRDSPEQRGTFSVPQDSTINDGSTQLLQSVDENAPVIYFGKYGSTTDPMEARRWDEKNGG
jgi:hypothetical protein